MRAALGAGTALVLAAGLVACGRDTPQPPPGPATASASPLWPLTGVRKPSPAEGRDRPALVVKVENTPAARPQTGLELADMVVEETVEGGITRFAAVFHSQVPGEVGPVRSIRPMDVPLAAPLGGLFAYSGGLGPFVSALRGSPSQDVGSERLPRAYHRVTSRAAPHNLYASGPALVAAADDAHRAAPGPAFRFAASADAATAVRTGRATGLIDLGISPVAHPSWSWAGDRWARSEGGAPATAASGARLTAANVIVLRVSLVDTQYRDAAGNPVPETQLLGASGEAIVASAGHTVSGRWSKAAAADPVEVTDAQGQRIALAPGPTWVELLPQAGSVTLR